MDLINLKKLREKHKITQYELAKRTNISQSLIAKIEAGKVDPAYSKAKTLIDFFEKYKSKTKKIKDVYNKRLLSVSAHEKVAKVIKLMIKYNLTELPVIDKGALVGFVNDQLLFNNLNKNLKNKTVVKIMQDPPPALDVNTELDSALALLKTENIIIVTDKGKIIGKLTKTDILKTI